MFSFFKRKDFFTAEEQQLIIEAIQNAERMTSGEVRVFVESKCSYMDAIDRAAELFFQLEMQKTDDRNAVLLYVAMKDRQLAVFGDEGIHGCAVAAKDLSTLRRCLDGFHWAHERDRLPARTRSGIGGDPRHL